jgi:hypothetical protein
MVYALLWVIKKGGYMIAYETDSIDKSRQFIIQVDEDELNWLVEVFDTYRDQNLFTKKDVKEENIVKIGARQTCRQRKEGRRLLWGLEF